jgi:hypothetical protein
MAEAWAKTTEAAVAGAIIQGTQGVILGSFGAHAGGTIGGAVGAVRGAQNEELQAKLAETRMNTAEFFDTGFGRVLGGALISSSAAAIGEVLLPGFGAIAGSIGGAIMGANGSNAERVERD